MKRCEETVETLCEWLLGWLDGPLSASDKAYVIATLKEELKRQRARKHK